MQTENSSDELNVVRTRIRNTLPGTEGSFRFSVSSLGTTRLDPFCERLARRAGYDRPVVKNIIDAAGEEIADIVLSYNYSVNAFGFRFESAIGGSVGAIDSPPGLDNVPYVAVYVDDELERSPEGLRPISSDSAVNASIDHFQDSETQQANVIVGRRVFAFIGHGLPTSLEGEGISVKSEVDGSEAMATITRSDEGRAIYATLDSALPAGKATVTVMTRGGDADAELWPVTKSITIVADDTPTGDEPEITNGYSNGHMDDPGKAYGGNSFMLEGFRFGDDAAAVSVKIGYTSAGQHRESEVAPEEMAVNDTYIEIYDSSVALMAALGAGGTITFTVTTDAGSDSYDAEVVQ